MNSTSQFEQQHAWRTAEYFGGVAMTHNVESVEGSSIKQGDAD